jgi:F-type H+-transporting ATPase subunit epsilon
MCLDSPARPPPPAPIKTNYLNMTLTVRVIAPDKTVWDGTADEVILPSITGQLGILTGHASLLTALDTAVMRVKSGKDKWTPIALMGGFAEVDNNEVTILVNGAELGEKIDREQAQKEFTEAEQKLATAQTGDRQDQIQANQAFKRARARLQAAAG